jgi:hypothetical protein
MLAFRGELIVSDELQRAADRLAGDPRVAAVWGFGSRARGEAGPRSDIAAWAGRFPQRPGPRLPGDQRQGWPSQSSR